MQIDYNKVSMISGLMNNILDSAVDVTEELLNSFKDGAAEALDDDEQKREKAAISELKKNITSTT